MPNLKFKSKYTIILFIVLILFTPNVSLLHADTNTLNFQSPLDGQKTISLCEGDKCSGIGIYIIMLYKYGLSIVGALVVIVMMIAGVIYLTAGGNITQVTTAKTFIKNALTGLVLLLTSYLLFITINPELVQFKPLSIKQVKNVPEVKEAEYSCSQHNNNITNCKSAQSKGCVYEGYTCRKRCADRNISNCKTDNKCTYIDGNCKDITTAVTEHQQKSGLTADCDKYNSGINDETGCKADRNCDYAKNTGCACCMYTPDFIAGLSAGSSCKTTNKQFCY